MRVALLDTETQGLDVEKDRVIEVAVTLYSLTHASPIESYACILKADSNAAESKNGISPALLSEHGLHSADVWERVMELSVEADCMCAHRAEFDKKFVDKATGEHGLHIDKLWVCSKTDLRWPGGLQGDHLVHLALALGLGVANAHRAGADVEMMSRILTRAAEKGANLEEMFRQGMRPKKRFVAHVPFDMNYMLKENGFLWEPTRKQWYRNMPPEDAEALSFRVVQQD